MDEQRPATTEARPDAYWRKTRKISYILLSIWLLTGFLSIFFARELDELRLYGWPVSFYMAAQGALLIYLAIVAFYAWYMRRLDRQYRKAERNRERDGKRDTA